ncbi:MAG: ABC transporter permease subunit [bacterium]|nr:ABC transporter permease subunit [bacterium]
MRRSSMLWYSIGLTILVGLTIAVYPTIRDDADTFTQLLESMPSGMMSFFGSSEVTELLSPSGFLNSRVNASIGSIVLAVFAISIGTAAIAGDEDRRTMDLLLATPTPRHRIVLERFAAMTTLVLVVAFVVLVVMTIGSFVVDMELSIANMIASNFMLALLALVFGSLALAIGGLTGRRSVTVAAAAGATVATYFINGLAELVDSLQGLQKLTPFYWLQRANPLRDGLSIEDTIIMLLVIAVSLGIAVWGFQRRDIAVN